jgi:hypothetical protein
VGNPFAATAYIMGDGAFYTMNEAGTELEANTTLTSIAPMEGIFVLAEEDGETLTFTTEEPSKNGAMMAINLSGPSTGSGTASSTTAVVDRAIVRFDGPSTPSTGSGTVSGTGGMLPKFQIRNGNTKIYIPMDGKEYAVVNVGRDAPWHVSTTMGVNELPVNFKAEHNGTYTLAFSTEGVTFRYLHLIDNMTGADVDLLALRPFEGPQGPQAQGPASYTFEGKTTDYASRFRLVFSICGDANGDNETFAFINNGNIIVNGEGTLQVIDMAGRVVRSSDVARNVSTTGMVAGVYVLRLINGDDIKVQKIVID